MADQEEAESQDHCCGLHCDDCGSRITELGSAIPLCRRCAAVHTEPCALIPLSYRIGTGFGQGVGWVSHCLFLALLLFGAARLVVSEVAVLYWQAVVSAAVLLVARGVAPDLSFSRETARAFLYHFRRTQEHGLAHKKVLSNLLDVALLRIVGPTFIVVVVILVAYYWGR